MLPAYGRIRKIVGLKKLPRPVDPTVPFVTAQTLTLLFPELAPLLKKVPNRLEGEERLYDAFIALDVLNEFRKSRPGQAAATDIDPEME
jgi:hypothetical protein